jgi:hypothetical protein
VLTGGCHCQAVRYEVAGAPFEPVLCHCTDCRAVSGAPALAWFTVRTGEFRYVIGAPKRYASSPRAVREFCDTCGAQLTFTENALAGRQFDVTIASLDDPEAVRPAQHIFVHSRLSWMSGLDTLPQRAGDLPASPLHTVG